MSDVVVVGLERIVWPRLPDFAAEGRQATS